MLLRPIGQGKASCLAANANSSRNTLAVWNWFAPPIAYETMKSEKRQMSSALLETVGRCSSALWQVKQAGSHEK